MKINKKEVLTETSRKTTAKRFLQHPSVYRTGKHVIETFAILTANNPDKQEFDRKSNDEFNKQLKNLMSYESPEGILQRYHFNYYKVKGKYGNKEDSFLIYNPTLKDAKSLATRFEQQSFIFGRNTDDGLIFEFWANKSKSGYVYSKLDERNFYNDITDAEDYFTQIARDFKISIPFDKFEFEDSEMMESFYNRYFTEETYKENFETNLSRSLDEGITFIGRAGARQKLKNRT